MSECRDEKSASAKVVIRDAVADDLDSLEGMWAELYRQHVEGGMLLAMRPDAARVWREEASEKLGSPAFLLYVACLRESGEVVGFACGRLKALPAIFVERRCGFLSETYVDPKARGLGVGSMLGEEAIARFRKLGVGSIEFQTIPGNPGGRNFWLAMGWKDELFQMRRIISD